MLAGLQITDGPMPLWTRVGEEVIINNPVNGDIYVAGQNVTINAPVRGDLVVAGGTVTINDSVTSDVLVGAGTVTINGYVGDDVRCAGGSVSVDGSVKGDAMVSAGEFLLKRNADLTGNLVAYGGVLEIDGSIGGNVTASGVDVKLRGAVEGSIDLKAEMIDVSGIVKGPSRIAANTIIIGPAARFDQDVRFWSDGGSLNVPVGVAHGPIVFDPALEVENGRWELLGFASVLVLLWYLGTALVMIWVIEYLFSQTFMNAAKVAFEQSVKSIGYGFLFFVGVPVIVAALAVTVLGIPLAAIVTVVYVILIVLATAITAIIISNWLNRVYYNSQWKMSRIVMVSFGMFVLLKLCSLTPFVGPALMAIMACMAFGAILISVRRKIRGEAP